MTTPQYVEFRSWLTSRSNYTRKTTGAIVSRLKRAGTYIVILAQSDSLKLIDELDSACREDGMSPSIRSQLKQAVKFYLEFADSRPL